MRSQVNVVAAILVIQYLAVAGHQHRNRVGKQEHSSGEGTGQPVKPLVANSNILQFYCVHQVMQRDVRISTTEASQ